MRDLDNPLLDRWIRRMPRCTATVRMIEHLRAGLLAAMRKGETVGALMGHQHDSATGSLVNYFGLARRRLRMTKVAMHTGAAVLPAFPIWDESLGKYRIRFEPAIPTVLAPGDDEADTVANTQNYTAAIERVVRAHPDQWLWVRTAGGSPPLPVSRRSMTRFLLHSTSKSLD